MAQSTKAITPEIFFSVFKVNQVIFSSLPIYSSSYEALAPTVFKIFCWQGKMPKLTKGHYSYPEAIGPYNFLLITTNLFIKLWGSNSNSIWDILLTRENAQIQIFFRIYSKVNQVIYSSLPINLSSFKSLVPTVFEIFCWQGKNAQNYNGP